MRIGIDAACWSNQRGYGRFTREMLTALLTLDRKNDYVFFVDSTTACLYDLPPNAEQIVVSLSQPPTKAASAHGRRSIPDLFKIGRSVSKEKLDLFLYTSVYTYFPIFSSAKKIVVIHDVIPEQFPELVFTKRRHRIFWNLKVRLAIKQADLIITVSEFSKNGIMEHFGMPEKDIRVVSEAADKIFRPVHNTKLLSDKLAYFGLNLTKGYILYVGGIAPHKNLSVLVNAFCKLIKDTNYKDIKLVLVGDYKEDVFFVDKSVEKLIKRRQIKDKVFFTGFVSDEDLVYLYNAASVFVLPSFCEGFGLPAVESMACGTPVIGSKTTSLPEVVGDAGLFFDPYDPDDLLDKLTYVLKDGVRNKLSSRSVQRAATFSWQESAEQVLEVFESVAS